MKISRMLSLGNHVFCLKIHIILQFQHFDHSIMSDAVVNHVTSAHDFPTSESQRVLERRTWHIVAAGLMVSEGATKKMVNLEKSV